MRRRSLPLLLFACNLLGASACNDKPSTEDPAVTRGRQAYMSTCIACHNMNPALPGAIGPELKGASRALLEAKVLTNSYPSGYTPKRNTTAMVPLPQMQPALDDLAAFLNDGGK